MTVTTSNRAIACDREVEQHDVNSGFLNTGRETPEAAPKSSKLSQATTIVQLAGINFLSSAINGVVLVSLPKVSSQLNLPVKLQTWPLSVYGLAVASTILPAGSLADAAGSRVVDLVGCFSSSILMLGGGLVQTGEQLVACRALHGVAVSLHLASSVGLVAQSIPSGRARNVAFSCLGLSQPLGFSVGLVLGGVFVDTLGWRMGYYLFGGLALLLSVVGLWALPHSEVKRTGREVAQRLTKEMDWVGSLLASAFMACLSYFLA